MKLTIEKVIIISVALFILYWMLFGAFSKSDEALLTYIAECMIWIPIGITALGMWTISFAVGVLPMLIFVHGYWSFLFIILFCFAVGLVLNWRLPKSSRPLARLWPLMCFMMGMAYKDFLYVNIENTSYIWWAAIWPMHL